jgi:hypothetical protein
MAAFQLAQGVDSTVRAWTDLLATPRFSIAPNLRFGHAAFAVGKYLLC